MSIVRVLTNVAALDKAFDYEAPPDVADRLGVGTMVRVSLAGRSVWGWVVEADVTPPAGVKVLPITKRRGWGPEPDVVALAEWAAWRWAGRRSALLRTASAQRAVPELPSASMRPPPPPRLSTKEASAVADMVAEAIAAPHDSPVVLRVPPSVEVIGAIAALAQIGPTLVVVPSIAGAASIAQRLRRSGAGVALVPEEWPQARAGSAIVIGSRAAGWAPCPDLAVAIVVDAHDEALRQQQSPTWDATVVVAERARRAGALCVFTSPCPTLGLMSQATRVLVAPRGVEREGWATIEVVDRRGEDPRLGLYSEPLVRLVRGGGSLACVINRKGRARLVGCKACGNLARCERCGSALGEAPSADPSPPSLLCPQCGFARPWVCDSCGSTAMRRLRVGVSRVREGLEALAGGRVVETLGERAVVGAPGIIVGTEAVLHGPRRYDAVAFIDFDSEVLAPRLRAPQEALALLARASRAVGGRAGRVLVQTRVPNHPVILAAVGADPDVVANAQRGPLAALRWPPYSALAALSGPGAAELAASVGAGGELEILGPDDGRWLLRAPDIATLADALAGTPRPAAKVRVEVDPARL